MSEEESKVIVEEKEEETPDDSASMPPPPEKAVEIEKMEEQKLKSKFPGNLYHSLHLHYKGSRIL